MYGTGKHIERLQLRDVGPFEDVTIRFPKGSDPNLADVYLLTGPNGTGKSTVLYALASVIGSGYMPLGQDLLAPRMREEGAFAAVQFENSIAVASFWGPSILDLASRLDASFENISHLNGIGSRRHSGVSYFSSGMPVYADLVSVPNISHTWAAFAYAGMRSIRDVVVKAVQEPTQSPFENSLSFTSTADSEILVNWIVSQNFRRLKAKESGNAERAALLERTLRKIEEVIGEVVEEPSFRFVFSDEDDNLRVEWRGTPLAFGVLPDGLKSIIGWVADLLMRLDRIAWINDTPILERCFLLLLDEVDIHLHPAWQRKVLPLVQRLFRNAQIIATTHSPFVVGSVDDARIISLGFRGGASVVISESEPQIGHSYSTVLRSIFGISSEFDVDTEKQLAEFHQAKRRLLNGDESASSDVKRISDVLAARSEELREIIAIELIQLRRQQNLRAAP